MNCCLFFSFHGTSARSSCLFPLRARQGGALATALRAIIFLWRWRNGALSPTKEKSILIVVSYFLSFLGCGKGGKKVRARLNNCLAVLLVLLFVHCDERAQKKACLLQFIFDQQLACIRIYLLARARWAGAHWRCARW
jgi:hypothetical protein